VALRKDGSVVAWGDNQYGQATVPAGLSNVMAVAAGGVHTVAQKNDGSVVAWGDDSYGQTYVPAGARSGVTAVAAGFYHTLALKTDGSVVAWGSNLYGQVTGNPTDSANASPVTLGGKTLTRVTAISAGYGHSLALRNDGTAVAWGWDISGQVTGTPTTNLPYFGLANPVTLEGEVLSGLRAIAAGGVYTLGLKNNGSVVAWGSSGQMTVPVAAQNGVIAIAAGNYHAVALRNDGSVVAWGSGGQMTVPVGVQSGVTAIGAGNGPTVVLVVPTAPEILTQPVSQLVNEGHEASFTVAATGFPLYYQWRRDGTDLDGAMSASYTLSSALTNHTGGYTVVVSNPAGSVTSTPPAVLTVNVLQLAITTEPVSLAVNVGKNASFSVSATGYPLYYQWRKDGVDLAGATNDTYKLLVLQTNQAGTYTVVVSNGAGSVTSAPAVLTVSPAAPGTVVEWGLIPEVPLAAQGGVTAIAAGGGDAEQSHSIPGYVLALKDDGSIVAWGNGPTDVPAACERGVIRIAAGFSHAAVLKSDSTVVAWGDNSVGQVTGTPTTNDGSAFAVAAPVTLLGQVLSNVTAVAAGWHHTVALKNDGTVVAWGDDTFGQLTGTSKTNVNSVVAIPVTLAGQVLSNVTAVSAGLLHTVALRNDGTVVAWGEDTDGPVTGTAGGGETANPVMIGGQVLSNVTAIAAGFYHTMALKNDGTVVAWGLNVTGTGDPNDVIAIANPVMTGDQVLRGVTAIAAGVPTVALKNDGTVVTWGDYEWAVPSGLNNVTAVAAGGLHTVVLIGTVPLLPTLNAKPNGNELMLSWATNSLGFTLQSAPRACY
jgi:alpha-tubulin suppressor-like RCC1 family protein